MTEIKCGNCVFWRAQAPGAAMGMCHFAPPTPVLVGIGQHPNSIIQANGRHNGAQIMVQGFFPPVSIDAGCGQFRPRPVIEDRPIDELPDGVAS